MRMFKLSVVFCAIMLLLPAGALGFDARLIRVGDKLKITFFETMDLPDVPGLEQGSKDNAKLRVFYQRTDLSGDYTVNAGGAVSLPILGSIDAAGKSTGELRASVLGAMHKATGRAGNVSVTIIQRQPVFVTGAVRNPGAYAYIPGMIAVQALALAGGSKHSNLDLSQAIGLLDRKNRTELDRDRLRKALARKAVLTATRDGAANITTPPRLVALSGPDAAKKLIDSEKKAVELHMQQKQSELAQKKQAAGAIRAEIAAIQEHISDLDAQTNAKSAQLKKMEALFANKIVVDQRVSSIRRQFLDLQARQSQYKIILTQTKNRLAQAEADIQQAQIAQRAEIDTEISQLDDKIAEAERSSHADERILSLESQRLPSSASGTRMEIIRIEGSGTQVFDAKDTTKLAPGDVLKVGTQPKATGSASPSPSGKASAAAPAK